MTPGSGATRGSSPFQRPCKLSRESQRPKLPAGHVPEPTDQCDHAPPPRSKRHVGCGPGLPGRARRFVGATPRCRPSSGQQRLQASWRLPQVATLSYRRPHLTSCNDVTAAATDGTATSDSRQSQSALQCLSSV
jgi:hypothetical protein